MAEKDEKVMNKLEEIKESIDQLSFHIQRLTDMIEQLNKTTGRMDNHISFVEGTYQTLKYPLNVLKNSVEKIFPNKAIEE
jgi:archaellum component FlaC